MTGRARAVAELLARARREGKRVFGFGGKERCAEAVKSVPADWTHLCAEGDRRWSWVGGETEGEKGEG